MNQKQKKRKNKPLLLLMSFFPFLAGGICGGLIGKEIFSYIENQPIWVTLLTVVGLVTIIYAALVLQMVIHEAGHLIFGLLSGYRFSSFRVFNVMWIKQDGKIRCKRFSLAGTGGQCLMSPPDLVDGKLPVLLYNLGGSILNLLSSAVFLGLYVLFSDILVLSAAMMILCVIGIVTALQNGIPMNVGMVNNDGYNAFSLTKDPEALRAFWIQMKVNEATVRGVRIKDMPAEWFTLPSDEAMQNSMVSVIGVLACNRLMEKQKFEEADALMEHMLEIESGMVGLHRRLMICDRLYVELITQCRPERLETMLSKEQKVFMKQMKQYPTVLRTEYAYALLYEKNAAKSEGILAQFEVRAKTYPYPSDMITERKLMDIAKQASVSA